MKIEIKINENLDTVWNNFIFKKNQHSIFLSKKFLEYHPKERFTEFNIYIYIDRELFVIIPCTKDKNSLFSHKGSTYGGIIQFLKFDKLTHQIIFQKLIAFLKSENIDNLTLRMPPREFNDDTEYSFFDAIEEKKELFQEEETYVDLRKNNFNDIKTSGFRRNHIRDIKKTIELENHLNYRKADTDEDLDNYYIILLENLKKHNVTPTHSKDEMRWLINNFKNEIWLDVLTFDEKIIAGLFCFKMNKSVLHYFYGSVDYNFEHKGAIKYIYWMSMLNAKNNNFKFVNFGVDSKHGEEPNISLKLFKEGFGGIHTHRKTVMIKC